MTRYIKTGTPSSIGAIDAELDKIQIANADTLSRLGDSPNQMEATLDMNSNDIINLPPPRFSTAPVRLQDLDGLGDGQREVYGSVAEMKSATPLLGVLIETEGYYTPLDGGGAVYKVINAADYTANLLGTGDHDLGNGLYAEMLKCSVANALQWGAKPDLITDNVQNLREALRYLKTLGSGGTLYLPMAGAGYLCSPLDLSNASSIRITGDRTILKYDNRVVGDYILAFTSTDNIIVDNIIFKGVALEDTTYDTLNRRAALQTTLSSFITIRDCVFEDFNSFGIFAQNMLGGTYTEGLRIYNNIFRNFTFDAATDVQSGIILSADAEYSIISHNSFFRIPQAVRFDDGANSIFSNNIVMQLNAEWNTSMAAVYSEYRASGNGGKLQIVNNKFNHIESGQIIIFCKGDPTKPQNPVIIEGNEILVSGDAVHSQLIVLSDHPNSRIVNNSLRPFAVVAGDASIRLNTSDNTVIENNYVRGGDYAITLNACTASIGKNIIDSVTTGKVQILSAGLANMYFNLSQAFRVTGASGTAGFPWSDTGVTVANVGTGHYEITHAFGNTDYTAMAVEDSSTDADIIFSIVRTSTTINIYSKTVGGVLTNVNFLLNVVHSPRSTYLL